MQTFVCKIECQSPLCTAWKQRWRHLHLCSIWLLILLISSFCLFFVFSLWLWQILQVPPTWQLLEGSSLQRLVRLCSSSSMYIRHRAAGSHWTCRAAQCYPQGIHHRWWSLCKRQQRILLWIDGGLKWIDQTWEHVHLAGSTHSNPASWLHLSVMLDSKEY